MHSFYEIFPDRVDLGGLIFYGGGLLIFEIIDFFFDFRLFCLVLGHSCESSRSGLIFTSVWGGGGGGWRSV